MISNIYHKTYSLTREILRSILPPRMYYFLRDMFFPGEIYCCYKFLENNKSNSVMIDVGAHVGGSLYNFALSGWKIFAFEPDNQNREKLNKLCKREKLTRVYVDSRAVSDKNEKQLSFYRSDISSGISGLSVFDESHREIQQVESITLADFCVEKNIKKVDYLKIDTEGWDYFVLKGFPFDKIKPDVILTEYENKKSVPLGYSWNDLAEFLVKNGYYVAVSEWYPVVQYGGNHKFRNISIYPCELMDINTTGNLVAALNQNNLNEIIVLVNKYLK